MTNETASQQQTDDAKIDLGGHSISGSEVKMYFEALENEFNRKNKRAHERIEHLSFRIKQLEDTVNRFQSVFNAIVQDEVLRKFREASERTESYVQQANRCATDKVDY
jgi:ElaB/YqjD/DUF883 family membrane-anchored ribosome-binding protein